MQVDIGNVITIKSPSVEIATYTKENLVISNPEYAKKLKMGFWLGNTPKQLELFEVVGDSVILPYGVLRDLLPLLPQNLSCSFQNSESVDYGNPIPLYDYQEEAVNAMVDSCYGILQSAAGSGKTQMGLAIIQRFGKRALWLTHTKDLLDQSRNRALQYMDKKLMGTITEGKVHIGTGITFATIQTMSKLDLERYKDYWDVIITDECHRVAGSPTSVSMFYKVLNSLRARHKYGLSATVHRADGLITATYSIIGNVVYSVPEEAVSEKVMTVGIQVVPTGTKLTSESLNTDGTLNYQLLINNLTKDYERNNLIVSQLVGNKRHSILILSSRVEHLETLKNLLPQDMQTYAAVINGKMTSKKMKAYREEAIEQMRSGKLKYLFATFSLAKEGLDVPRLDRLFLVTPESDYAVVTQSIGRIARTFDGKESPVAYDFVDDFRKAVFWYKARVRHYTKAGCEFVEVDR